MTSRKEAEQKMKDVAGTGPRDTKLTGHDFQDDIVAVQHGDGTFLFFKSAFALKWKEWYFIFTEHNGYHLFNDEEGMCQITQYQNKDISPAEGFEISAESAKYWERKAQYDKA